MPLGYDDYKSVINEMYLLNDEEERETAKIMQQNAERLIQTMNAEIPQEFTNQDWLDLLNSKDEPGAPSHILPENIDIHSKEAVLQLFNWTLQELAGFEPQKMKYTGFAEYHKNFDKNHYLLQLASRSGKMIEALQSVDRTLPDNEPIVSEMKQVCRGICEAGRIAAHDAGKYTSPAALIADIAVLGPEQIDKLQELAERKNDDELKNFCNTMRQPPAAPGNIRIFPQGQTALENIRLYKNLNYLLPPEDESPDNIQMAFDVAMQKADEAYPAEGEIPVTRKSGQQNNIAEIYRDVLDTAVHVHLQYAKKILNPASTYDYEAAAAKHLNLHQVLEEQQQNQKVESYAGYLLIAAEKDLAQRNRILQQADNIMASRQIVYHPKVMEAALRKTRIPMRQITPGEAERSRNQEYRSIYTALKKKQITKAVLNTGDQIRWLNALMLKPDLSEQQRQELIRLYQSQDIRDQDKLASYYLDELNQFTQKYDTAALDLKTYLANSDQMFYYQQLAFNFESFLDSSNPGSAVKNTSLINARYPGFLPELKNLASGISSLISRAENELNLICLPISDQVSMDFLKDSRNREKLLTALGEAGPEGIPMLLWIQNAEYMVRDENILSRKDSTSIANQYVQYNTLNGDQYFSQGETDLRGGDLNILPFEQYYSFLNGKIYAAFNNLEEARKNIPQYIAMMRNCRGKNPAGEKELDQLQKLNETIRKDLEDGLKTFKDPQYAYYTDTSRRMIQFLQADAAILQQLKKDHLIRKGPWQDVLPLAKAKVQETYSVKDKTDLQIQNFRQNQTRLKENIKNRKNELIKSIEDSQNRMKDLEKETWQDIANLANQMDHIQGHNIFNSEEFSGMKTALRNLSEHRPDSIRDFLSQMQKLRHTSRLYTKAKDQDLYSRTVLQEDEKQNRFSGRGKERYRLAEKAEQVADHFIREIQKENKLQKTSYDYLLKIHPEIKADAGVPSFTAQKNERDEEHLTIEQAKEIRNELAMMLNDEFKPALFCKYQILNEMLVRHHSSAIRRMTETDLQERTERMQKTAAMKMMQKYLQNPAGLEQMSACWQVCKDAAAELEGAEKLSLEALEAKQKKLASGHPEHTSGIPAFDRAIVNDRNARLQTIYQNEKKQRLKAFAQDLKKEDGSDFRCFCRNITVPENLQNRSSVHLSEETYSMLVIAELLNRNMSADDIMDPSAKKKEKEDACRRIETLIAGENADQQLKTLFEKAAEKLPDAVQDSAFRIDYSRPASHTADARRMQFLANTAAVMDQVSAEINPERTENFIHTMDYMTGLGSTLPPEDFRSTMKQSLRGDHVQPEKLKLLFQKLLAAGSFAKKHGAELAERQDCIAEDPEDTLNTLKDLSLQYTYQTIQACEDQHEAMDALTTGIAGNKENYELLAPFLEDGSITELFAMKCTEHTVRNAQGLQEVNASVQITRVPSAEACLTWAKKRCLQQEKQFGRFIAAKAHEYKNIANQNMKEVLQEGQDALTKMYNRLIPAHGISTPEKAKQIAELMQQYTKAEWMKNCADSSRKPDELDHMYQEFVGKDPKMQQMMLHPDSNALFRFTAGGECGRILHSILQQDAVQQQLHPEKQAPDAPQDEIPDLLKKLQ